MIKFQKAHNTSYITIKSLKMAKLRVLIIDDDPAYLTFCIAVLSDDYIVQTSLSGSEALKTVTNFKPNIILLDIMMPIMDGIETCAKLRKMEVCLGSKIIFASAIDDSEIKTACRDVGGDDFLCKPFEHEVLLNAIES